MTTNNSHFEQSDVQTTVAEYAPVSETATETSTTLPSDTVTPLPEGQTQTDEPAEASLLETQREPAPEMPADEPIEATLLETQREPVQETSPETSSAISSTATEPEVAEIEAEQQSTPEVTVVVEQEQIAPVVIAVDIQAETENVTAEPAAAQPSEETPQQTEEVRPFTDFIKEFRRHVSMLRCRPTRQNPLQTSSKIPLSRLHQAYRQNPHKRTRHLSWSYPSHLRISYKPLPPP